MFKVGDKLTLENDRASGYSFGSFLAEKASSLYKYKVGDICEVESIHSEKSINVKFEDGNIERSLWYLRFKKFKRETPTYQQLLDKL